MVQIQPRKHALVHVARLPPGIIELERTDQEPICPGGSIDHQVGLDHTDRLPDVNEYRTDT